MAGTTSVRTDATSLSILRAVVANFEQHLLPALKDDKAAIYGGLIFRALQYLENRESGIAAATSDQITRRAELLEQSTQLLSQSAAITAPFSELIRGSLDLLNERGGQAGRARDLLRAMAQSEFEYFAALDRESNTGGGGSHRGGRADDKGIAGEDPLNLTALKRWAREVWGDDRDVTELVPLPGGFSKTTALLTVRDPAGQHHYVLRRDLPIALLEQSVVDEYPLLVQLHADGFAVARPVCVEPRKEFIGGAFMISERLPGSVDFAVWKKDSVKVRRIARSFAGFLAQLHRYEITPAREQSMRLGLTDLSSYDAMAREIERWYVLYRKKTNAEQPLLELAFAWLKRNIPADLKQRRACLLHGDAGLHNLLVDDDGNITALLDWEFHHLGDPGEEVHYTRMYIEQVMDWQEFLGYYTQAGGTVYPDSQGFYSVWNETRNCVGCVDSAALFESILPEELKLAVAGYVFGPRLQVAAGSKVMDIIDPAARSKS